MEKRRGHVRRAVRTALIGAAAGALAAGALVEMADDVLPGGLPLASAVDVRPPVLAVAGFQQPFFTSGREEEPSAGVAAADVLPVPVPDAVTPVEAKLDGALLEMVRGQRDGQDADVVRVAVEIVCESPDHVAAVQEQVVAVGGAVTGSFEDHLWAEVPLTAVEGLAATPAVWTMALNRAVVRPTR